MALPRIRIDLEAAALEEGGLRYFDVVDPRSGTSMRLYEHEWLLASRMDGATSLESLARWAGEEFGFHPTASDLAVYARRLGELGFFDEPVDVEVSAAPHAAATEKSGRSHVPERVPPEKTPFQKTLTGVGQPDETSFEGLGEDTVQTADMRPEVIAAIRTNAIVETIEQSRVTSPLSALQSGKVAEGVAKAIRDEKAASSGEPAVVVEDQAPPREKPPVRPATREQRPIRPAPHPERTQPAPPTTNLKPSRGPLYAALVLVAIAGLGAVAYYATLQPKLQPVKVRVATVAAPKDVFRFYETKGIVVRSTPVTLSFGEGGKLVDVVPVGTESKPGMTLASLDTYAAMEKELADVREREVFYENALKVANAKHRAGDAAKAAAKVDEKRKRRAVLEEKVGKARIVAAGVATVGEVLVTPGTPVAAGAPVLRLADKRTLVEGKPAAAEAKQWKVGQVVGIATAGGAASGSARVVSADDEALKLEVVDDAGGSIKNGDAVSLVQSKLGSVVRVPTAAVGKSQGGVDQVLVLVGDTVRARPVNIAERSSEEVLVTAGLAAGDRVILSPPADLGEGAKATAE